MTPTDKPMTVDVLMKLATDYAHCYAFVGDDTMPRRQAELRAAIERYGREQGFESTAQRDVREAYYELRDALGNPVISGTGDQTLQGQTIRMAAARLRGSGEPVATIVECEPVEKDDDVAHGRPIVDRAIDWYADDIAHLPVGALLYAAPQPREPLTDEQIDSAIAEHVDPIATYGRLVAFARAIERAHDIRSEG